MTSLLLRMAQQSTMLKIIPMICRAANTNHLIIRHHVRMCIPDFSLLPAHHDTSNSYAHVSDDEEFTVEEVFDARLAVLQRRCFVRHQTHSFDINQFNFCWLYRAARGLTRVSFSASGHRFSIVPQQLSLKWEEKYEKTRPIIGSIKKKQWVLIYVVDHNCFLLYVPLSGKRGSKCRCCFHCRFLRRSSGHLQLSV